MRSIASSVWKSRPAFSLVEVVFVVALLGILGSIAVPRYAGFVARQQSDAAARRLVSDLALAQRQARLSSSTQRVQFDVGGSRYRFTNLKDPDRPQQDYAVDLSQDPYRAVIVHADFAGAAEVAYDGYGAASSPGTVVLGVGRYRQVITVDGGATRPRMNNRVTVEAVE
jgi:prepilin-type N-terminal cleavage/methylation domain-containing protein